MRIANYDGRVAALVGEDVVDIATASGGRFQGGVLEALDHWDELKDVVAGYSGERVRLDAARLGAPIPLPRQVFAVGLNYLDHAAEANITDLPKAPIVFTKFPSSITGPDAEVDLPSPFVDFEVELVAVIGRRADRVHEATAWDHVAGLMVGQDITERRVQHAGPMPQWSLSKSYRGFGPTGPVIVTLDELSDPDSLEIGCRIGDEVLQAGNTKEMIFSVPDLIARISRFCPLLPGDLLFTGTPAGVGAGRDPQRYLVPGETLTSFVGGVGTIRTHLVAAA